jgi:nucleotide-binding universal stress UspA family protein
MDARGPVLCPVDFSDASAGALRYGSAIADAAGVALIVLTVEDPLLTEAVDLGTGVVWNAGATRIELARFAGKALGDGTHAPAAPDFRVAVGKPAAEILRVARDESCSLVVMSTHGLTGMRKLFFGSTTERVLRETGRPVLVTPPADPGPATFEEARQQVRRILVPLDLSPASAVQVQGVRRLAETLGASLILAHVVEPLKSRLAAKLLIAGIEGDRRAVAEDALNQLIDSVPGSLRSEALLAYGDPAEELAKVARDRRVGLIVMGLHGSPLLGPRMGSVTYRLLCLAPTLTLALPPLTAESAAEAVALDPATATEA